MTSNISSKIELDCTRLYREDASVINFWPFATDMIAARFVTTCDLCDMWGRAMSKDDDDDHEEGMRMRVRMRTRTRMMMMMMMMICWCWCWCWCCWCWCWWCWWCCCWWWWCGDVVMWFKIQVKERKQQVRSEGQSWKFRVSSFQSRHGAVFAHPQPQNWRTPCAGKWCLDQSGV